MVLILDSLCQCNALPASQAYLLIRFAEQSIHLSGNGPENELEKNENRLFPISRKSWKREQNHRREGCDELQGAPSHELSVLTFPANLHGILANNECLSRILVLTANHGPTVNI